MTPAQFFYDNPDARRAYELIEAAHIPQPMSFNCFDAWPSEALYNAKAIEADLHNERRLQAVQDVAAALVEAWPHPETRNRLMFDLLRYVERDWALSQLVMELFKACRNVAAQQLQETK